MSSHTLASAHDAINKLVSDVLTAQNVLTIFEDLPLNVAQEAIIEGKTTPVKPWARIGIKDNLRTQETIGGVGQRRFDNNGIVIVELYTPAWDGLTLAHTLAPLIRNVFEGINVGALWFRNTRTNPVGPDGFWFHTNVISEFEWQELK